jgi:hypothetical protein
LVLLVPIAIHTAWDNYEARRLSRIVSEIKAKNEPVRAVTTTSEGAESPRNAARYYEAAAALIDSRDFYDATGILRRLDHAQDADRPKLLEDIRAWLDRNHEAEALLARATVLPFSGYPPGTGYSYRADRLVKLARLAYLRTFERLDAHDPEPAGQSIVQQLRINRPLSASGPTDLDVFGISWAVIPALIEIGRWLEAQPADPSLGTVQDAIAEVDNDRLAENAAVAERAFFARMLWSDAQGWYANPNPRDVSDQLSWYLMRPLMVHRFIGTIKLMTTLRERASQPWPEPLHISVPNNPGGQPARGRFPFLSNVAAFNHTVAESYRSRTTNIATALALARTANAAIAIERYRRANAGLPPTALETLVPKYLDRVPTDPFSGVAIRYLRQPERVVVYSLGANEKDDGGVNVNYPVRQSGAFQARSAPADLGVRLTVSSRR